MKKCILIVNIVFICCTVNGQPKTVKDSVGKVIRERINKLPPADDYSNFKSDPRARQLTIQILKRQRLDNTIVVIDNKIYRLDSKEYLQLNRGDSLVVKPTIIMDTASQAAIKYILIFKTKNKP